MDLGLYNKRASPRGEHGTLIGNWVEERALRSTTGHARYPAEDLALEKRALNLTQDRVLAHRDNLDSPAATRDRFTSTNAATYVEHSPTNFTPKIFNQTGSHWHHDQGPTVSGGVTQGLDGSFGASASLGSPQPRRDQMSHIAFGDGQRSPFATTQGSSFLHASALLPTERVPLALQRQQGLTASFVPRPFPDTHVRGATLTSKLDRPYAPDQQ